MAARKSKAAAETDQAAAESFVELVSPDGEKQRTPRNNEEDVKLRFQGYLPADQQKEVAPEPVEPSGPKTVETPPAP